MNSTKKYMNDFNDFSKNNLKILYLHQYYAENPGIHGGVNIPLPDEVKRDTGLKGAPQATVPRTESATTSTGTNPKKANASSKKNANNAGVATAMVHLAVQGELRYKLAARKCAMLEKSHRMMEKSHRMAEYGKLEERLAKPNESTRKMKKELCNMQSNESENSDIGELQEVIKRITNQISTVQNMADRTCDEILREQSNSEETGISISGEENSSGRTMQGKNNRNVAIDLACNSDDNECCRSPVLNGWI